MTTIPTREDVLKDVAHLLKSGLGVAPWSPIDENTRFFADLGLASIDAVVLSEAIREHYQRPLPFDLLLAEIGRRDQRDLTIGELVAFIRNNLQGPAQGPNEHNA